MDANMQLTINSFRPLFPDKIFSQFPWLLVKSDISPTAVKFPDISSFSRQVVTLFSTSQCGMNGSHRLQQYALQATDTQTDSAVVLRGPPENAKADS